MTSTNSEEQGRLIPTDKMGRMRIAKEQREALLAEYDRGGMSGQAFAAWAGIKYPTFASWVQNRRKRQGIDPTSKPAPKLEWVEAVVEKKSETEPGEVLWVHLAHGARLEVSSGRQVLLAVELMRSLGQRC